MNIARRILCGLVAVLTVTVAAQAETPAGWWLADNNGYVGMVILNVENTGIVTGTAFGDNIQGFWNASTGKLVFYRAIGANVVGNGWEMDPNSIQIFTGYMFQCTAPGPLGGNRCLAGTFESFAGTGANKQRNVFGWSAQSLVD